MSNQLETSELAELHASSEDDIGISADGNAYYHSRLIAPANDEGNPDYAAIWQWMEDNRYFPNVWQYNDHHNVELISIAPSEQDGEFSVTYHGGLV